MKSVLRNTGRFFKPPQALARSPFWRPSVNWSRNVDMRYIFSILAGASQSSFFYPRVLEASMTEYEYFLQSFATKEYSVKKSIPYMQAAVWFRILNTEADVLLRPMIAQYLSSIINQADQIKLQRVYAPGNMRHHLSTYTLNMDEVATMVKLKPMDAFYLKKFSTAEINLVNRLGQVVIKSGGHILDLDVEKKLLNIIDGFQNKKSTTTISRRRP